ncbi:Met-10+ like-protein-domain-containing protein [Gloeopeniophorella convolvens]|nr:Met-10+ like-protein-domain-containing protein [Gloeopeniophorella convolvens]
MRGMRAAALDRRAFRRTIPVLAARLPASQTGRVLKAEAMRGCIIDLPRIRSVVRAPGADADADADAKLVVLRVQRAGARPAPRARAYLAALGADLVPHDIELDYDYWGAELRDGAPSGFAATGHLVRACSSFCGSHLNLNSEYLPYKHIIGQIVLDKNKRIRTVVNKLDSIDTQFRFFKMELLAGEPDYVVQHHESDCRFTFDFSRHERLVGLFQPSDLIADVFAGVGPFALPAAKKGCAVLANDLNPESYKYLAINIGDNKVADRVRASCEDGREFIQNAARRVAADPVAGYAGPPLSHAQRRARERATPRGASPPPAPPPRRRIAHYIMNLPDSAITFLDAFRGALASADLAALYDVMPTVHCHCFTREMERGAAERDIRQRVEARLGCVLGTEEDGVSLHLVRSVAPNKDMYCISFRLPRSVAFGS